MTCNRHEVDSNLNKKEHDRKEGSNAEKISIKNLEEKTNEQWKLESACAEEKYNVCY